MDFDEGMGEQDPGPLVYQEVKVFHTEPTLCNVYDNTEKRFVTFEIYGLDTQQTLKLKYDYPAYDQLFRFNAELMNPNRKEGRFHWTIERITVTVSGSGERKIKLGEKPTEEVAQLPTYETNRKIPTGRMDLKERQRLREQMDVLDIRRAENIARKRAATKERILKHIFFLKEEQIRRKQEQADRMEAERQLRFKKKEDEERKEEEALKILETKARLRRKAIEAVMNRNEEQEEFELAELRRRWQSADDEKARIIKDAIERRDRIKSEARNADSALRKKRSDCQNKRLMVWKNRDGRNKQKDNDWLQRIFEEKTVIGRNRKMLVERKQTYLREWDAIRIPTFSAQLARQYEREESRFAEQEAVNAFNEKRAVPKKVNLKGHKNKKATKKEEPKKDEEKSGDAKSAGKKKKDDKKADSKKKEDEPAPKKEEAKSDKQDMEKVLDSVEVKMRQEMEEARKRARMDKIREEKIAELDKERRMREVKHMSEVKEAHRNKKLEEDKTFAERVIVMREKDAELLASKTRKAAERARLDRARQERIAKKEALWQAKVTGDKTK